MVLFFCCIFNASGSEVVNIARNLKDIPDTGMQEDTVAEGTTWLEDINGYPHVTASSRKSLRDGENNIVNGRLDDCWRNREDSEYPHWLKIDFGKKKIFNKLKIYTDKSNTKLDDFLIEVSNDDFKKDIRKVYEIKAGGNGCLNTVITFKSVEAVYVRIIMTKGSGALNIREVEVYEVNSGMGNEIWKAATLETSDTGFIYSNKDNLAFNANDVQDGKWDSVKNGYPHVTASDYIKPGKMGISPLPSYVIDGTYDSAHGWTLPFGKWWGAWLKIDFGKETTFRYIKIFSSSLWPMSAERRYLPKTFSIEISNDDFKTDSRKVFSSPPSSITEVWNYLKDDSKKIVDLKDAVNARYVRFNFPEGQEPNRLWIDEIEIYKNTPPEKKIEKILTQKPKLGSKVKAQILGKNSSYTAWLEGNTRKVFKDDEVIVSEPDNTIRISAAKGEKESFQIVITPKRKIGGLRLSIGDLKMRGKSDIAISGANVKYNPVGYVYICYPTCMPLGGGIIGKGKVGDWPDPLLEEDTVNIEEIRNYPIWVTVNVPENAQAGTYEGSIQIAADNIPSETIKLALKVRDFSVAPQGCHYLFMGNPSFRYLLPYYRIAFNGKFSDKEIAYMIYKAMAKYKFNGLAFQSLPEFGMPRIEIKDNKLQINTKEFDELSSFLINTLGFKYILFPIHTYNGAIGRLGGSSWLTYPYMSKEYKKYFLGTDGYIAQMAKHLEEKGWMNKFYLELWHEPQIKNCFEDAYTVAKIIKGLNPGIQLQVGGYAYDEDKSRLPRLLNSLNIYPSAANIESLQELKQSTPDLKVWGVYNGISEIDYPAITNRIMAWSVRKAEMTGIAHYSLFAMSDPWDNPFGMLAGASRDIRNGDSWVFYPMRNGNSLMPYLVASIRLAVEAESWEDYEYFWLLNDRITKLGNIKSLSDKHTEALKKAKAVLKNADENVVITYGKKTKNSEFQWEYDENPQKLYEVREQMGEQIELLGEILKKF